MATTRGELQAKGLGNRLLLIAGIYTMTGGALVSLLLYDGPRWQSAGAALLITAGFLFIHLVWRKRNFSPDPYILPVLQVLTATGIFFLFRFNIYYGSRQLVWLFVGLGFLFLVTVFYKYNHFFLKYKYFLAAGGALALILPIFLGVELGGARSWLDFDFFHLQTSEFAKLLLVLFLAAYFAEHRNLLVPDSGELVDRLLLLARHWGPLLSMLALSLLILVFQKDLGMALLYFVTFLALVYVATGRISYVWLGFGLFLLCSIFAYYAFAHVQTRVEIWVNPWQPNLINDSSYQLIQSLFAIKAGGILGAGLGAGYPGFIPAVHTDFVFSAICEEMGLLGGVGMIVLYMILVVRGLGIAIKARDDFSTLLATGLTVLLGVQVFVIIAGVTKLLPLTGVTLPFISYGGSSLVANFILIGLLINISHHSGDHH